ncbi:MAG: acylphosphatase [Chloroflexi bacterium]|nr:acylphosphatase [Chloroflexota bacterium]
MPDVAAHVVIRGRVQGVGYRVSLWQQARHQGLKGWVRNLENGSVEGMLQGPRSAVESVLGWTRVGPPGARVSGVDVDWVDPTDAFEDFDILG